MANNTDSNNNDLKTSLDFQTRLNSLMGLIHGGGNFSDIMPEVEKRILEILGAERITIYQRNRNEKSIVSRFQSGEDIKEIRVPLTTSSIAGYVALSKKGVCLKDVYDEDSLKKINSNLRFNKSYDKKSGFRTKSVITVPIQSKEVLLGVLQVLNKVEGECFDREDAKHAAQLAGILGQKFRYELGGTQGPYDYLVQTKKIKPAQLEELELRSQKEETPMTELLISGAGISAVELGLSLEKYYQVPFMAYDPELEIPTELTKNVNAEYLKQNLWVPIGVTDDEVEILIDNPTDAQRIMEIQRALPGKSFIFRVGFPEDILRFLGQGQGLTGNVDLHELVGKLQDEVEEITTEAIEEVDENEATVIQLVNHLIVSACKEGASDIHIEPGKRKANATVRFRVDGACRSSLTIPASHVGAVVSRIKIMSTLDIAERRKPQDGKCAVKFKGRLVELRVATIPTVNGESVVLRVLSSSEPLPLEKLNLTERNLTELQKLVTRPHGILLVVGPTGSGKTTTLHAVLAEINTPDKKIWTVEDPVEITQAGLQQVQVKPKINLDFASALRAFLRADPDIIMIGEMRDRETAHIGVEASLTGHLVLSTLHTNSAAETITRLLDLGIDPVSFSDALLGVLAQRLVRTLCDKCKESYPIPESEYNALMRYYGEEHFSELGLEVEKTEIFKAVGCKECGNTGYKGRTGIHEFLVGTESIKHLIYKGENANTLATAAIEDGMRTLMQDGIQKLLAGQTDIMQIRRVASA